MADDKIFVIATIIVLLIAIIVAITLLFYSKKKSKLLIFLNTFIIFILFTLLSFNIYNLYCLYNDTLKIVYTSAFEYYTCLSQQLLENDCDEANSILQASIAKAELAGNKNNTISTTEKLAKYEANPKQISSPYTKITKSLYHYPLYIIPEKSNYQIFSNKECPDIKKPIYWVVGWKQIEYTIHITTIKFDKCPPTFLIDDKFPFITEKQYQLLNEGQYLKNENKYSLEKIKMIEVVDITQNNEYFKSLDNNTTNSAPFVLSKPNTPSSNTKNRIYETPNLSLINHYGKSNLGVFKWGSTCFITFVGKDDNAEAKNLLLWFPDTPKVMYIFPLTIRIDTALTILRNYFQNDKPTAIEPSSNYLLLGNNRYALHRQPYATTSPPIYVIYYNEDPTPNLITGAYFPIVFNKPTNKTINYGLYGMSEALDAVKSNCNN